MASISSASLFQDRGLRHTVSANAYLARKPRFTQLQTSFLSSRTFRVTFGCTDSEKRKRRQFSIKCENKDKDKETEKDKDEHYKHVSVERPPYYSYMDSTSGQLEPASGARASIPGQEYWPEGTASQVRAAQAPEPTGNSLGSPSYGKNPGSRRRKQATSVSAREVYDITVESSVPESDEDSGEDTKDGRSEFVVYQAEPEEEEEEEEEEGYALDKKLGRPHAFIDPKVKKPIENPLTSEELWWNWRKPDKEQWSRWQRRKPDVETVFLKAMAETGQVKLYGEIPTHTETALYRARREIFKEERLQAEEERLEREGSIAYYSEWVKAWKKDTSKEAIQKHYEETGENEATQLIEMFSHQTDREYRIMMGTDIRIKRDPLAMRMREDLIKQIWGGDPVYPTVNYIQDPNEIADYRGPNFHEPTPNMLSYLKEHGKIISREEIDAILAEEKTEEVQQVPDLDDAMSRAIDIGENDDEEDSEVEDEVAGEEDEDSKLSRNWSVLKSTPQLRKSKGKPKKDGPVSLDEAVDESENLTDFLMDFDEDEA